MDLPFNYSMRRYNKYFFQKYFLYALLGTLIFVNILLFPNLLNHKDIKLNDMSYLMVSESNTLNADKEATQVETKSGDEVKGVPVEVSTDKVSEQPGNGVVAPATKDSPKFMDDNNTIQTANGVAEVKTVPEEENIKPRSNAYLLFLTLILCALLISLGVFIYSNFDLIKATLIARKSPYFKESLNGYELLED